MVNHVSYGGCQMNRVTATRIGVAPLINHGPCSEHQVPTRLTAVSASSAWNLVLISKF